MHTQNHTLEMNSLFESSDSSRVREEDLNHLSCLSL